MLSKNSVKLAFWFICFAYVLVIVSFNDLGILITQAVTLSGLALIFYVQYI